MPVGFYREALLGFVSFFSFSGYGRGWFQGFRGFKFSRLEESGGFSWFLGFSGLGPDVSGFEL